MNDEFFAPQIYWMALSRGDRGFPFIRSQGGVASIEEVTELKRACESHLAILDQAEIDEHNDEARRRVHEECLRESRTAPSKRPPRTGHIYLMRNKRNGFTKIGFSKNPRHRERTLQAEDPDVEILLTFPATFPEEEKVHEKFAAKRIRGEWFNLDESDIERIRAERAA